MVDSNDVKDLLGAYGYEAKDSDEVLIELAIGGVESHIRNYCHLYEIPFELYDTAVEMVAGTFLKAKISVGEKVTDLIDLDSGNVASITEGDVSVSYNNSGDSSSVSRYLSFIDNMCNKDDELLHFRRLKW